MKNILFVHGIPDHRKARVLRVNPLTGDISYNYNGGCELNKHLTETAWKRQSVVLDTRNLKMTFQGTHCIVNQIAEADLCQVTLTHLSRLLEQHADIPVFNHPQHVLKTRRDEVYHLLKDIDGITAPKTIRVSPQSPEEVLKQVEANISYPAIIKACGEHNGRAMLRLNGPEDMMALHALPLDGRDYYLIEYVDVSQGGVYHKHRIALVQGKSFPRHSCYFDQWQINYDKASRGFMKKHSQYAHQERTFLKYYYQNHEADLAERFEQIYQRIPLDLVGLDCAMLNGELVIFELNANMQLFDILKEDLKHLKQPVQRIREAVTRTIHQKAHHA